MKKIAVFAALIILTSLALVSCSDSVNDTSGNGRIKMYLVDAPAALDSVILNVVRVEVHSEADGWIVVNDSAKYYDLLVLTNGASAVLGESFLPPGEYTQIRLILGDDNYIYVDGTKYDLETPSGQQTGLKLIHGFEIMPDNLYELYVDFNADKSIHQTGSGKYMLKPTVRVEAAIISGTISGQVLPLDADATVWTVAGEDTVTTFTNDEGFFKLMCLPAGTYDVFIDPENPAYTRDTVTGVIVTPQQNTDIGVITLQ